MAQMQRPQFLFPTGACLGVDNVLLHAKAARHRVDNYAGPLSIKTVLNGRVAWTVGGRELVVDRSSFLVLGEGERYSMNIAAARPVETCCAFFQPGFVERIVLDATSSLETSLEQPNRIAPTPAYLSALHTDRERNIVRRVQGLAGQCSAASGFEEGFLLLATELIHLYGEIREQAARVPAERASTRQELFRRLLIGREYMHAESAGKVSLEAVARAACLSPFHFHRTFVQSFKQTPHAYLTSLRLAQARALIEAGAKVLDACMEVGFISPTAFSRLFRAKFGVPPSAYQKRKFARSGKKAADESGILDT